MMNKILNNWYIFGLIAFLIIIIIIVIYGSTNEVKQPQNTKEIPDVVELKGDFITWDEINPLFSKYSNAIITDVDTKKSFQVQRRGGTYHVDVQPLTAKDTEIMKSIYNNSWSWKRRAVVVELDNGRKIAGSMNGMPHGGGNIANNNFNGHFCIHFKDSKTHGSRKVDVAHQMMTWKAADIIDYQLKTLTAEETVLVFFAAIDQKEKNIFQKTINNDDHKYEYLMDIDSLNSVKVDSIKEVETNNFHVSLRITYEGSDAPLNKQVNIKTIRKAGQWKITEESSDIIIED